MKEEKARKQNETGFTLIELMIAMAISGIILAAVYFTFNFQNRTYIAEEEITAMQQNIRGAILKLEKDLRMAGFDPSETTGATFLAAGPNSFSFTYLADDDDYDNDGDKITDESGELETVSYQLYDFPASDPDDDMDIGISKSEKVPPVSGWRPIAENIEAVEYFYTLADGTQTITPADPGSIRAIKIWILARTGREISSFTDTRTYTTPSGASINKGKPFNDNFRRRILTAMVRCRNME